MQKTFISTIIINGVLSLLFLVLASYAVITEKIVSEDDIVFLIFFLLIYFILLWQSIACWQILKKNQQLTSLTGGKMLVGKIICGIASLLAVILIVTAVAGIISFEMYSTKQHLRYKTGYFITTMVIIISCLAAILNCIFYFKAVKQNKAIVNSVINTIGENASQ